ncbi:MAG: hypothetical protein ACT4PV_14795 [Planctomycetaceae bacterium]
MANKKAAKESPKAKEPKGGGTTALVVRIPVEALKYIDEAAGDRPRTAFVRDVMAKGDPKLGKLFEAK